MAFDKITQADLTGKGVIGLPDTPQLPTMQMQQKLDEIALDVIVPKFNAVVDKLNDPAGADDTQVTDPTTGLAGSLNDALQNIEDENAMNTLNRHNHANLGTLDAITAETKDDYDRLVTLLGAITAIQNVLSGATDEIPTGKATSDAIQTVQDEVDLNTLARHTHDNKATLDDITAQVKQGYDRIVTLLTGITGVETTLTNANDKIARSDAVYTAIDNLAQIVALNTAARHTHANKATLDAIDALTKQAYDALVTTFSGMTVEQTVTNDASKLPSGAAVVAYVSSLGGGDMLKSRYDTNDDGTVDSADYATNAGDSTRLGGLLSSAYASTTDVQKLFGDVATYQGTSTVALRNYAVGDFMIYNNYFYEVTQAISQGGSIVVNSNITQKTIGEVLTRLGNAEYVGYDNTDSGMSANNVQDAIDELNAEIAYTEIATASANQTLGAQATALYSPFTKLTLEQKRRSAIIFDNNVLRCNKLDGRFSGMVGTIYGISMWFVTLSNSGSYVDAQIATNGTATFTNRSSETYSFDMKLVLLN